MISVEEIKETLKGCNGWNRGHYILHVLKGAPEEVLGNIAMIEGLTSTWYDRVISHPTSPSCWISSNNISTEVQGIKEIGQTGNIIALGYMEFIYSHEETRNKETYSVDAFVTDNMGIKQQGCGIVRCYRDIATFTYPNAPRKLQGRLNYEMVVGGQTPESFYQQYSIHGDKNEEMIRRAAQQRIKAEDDIDLHKIVQASIKLLRYSTNLPPVRRAS